MPEEEPSKFDPSGERKRELTMMREEKKEKEEKEVRLPDSLIPEEYHVVKSRATMGLEYHTEKYTTKVKDHECHLTAFPSMQPTSRFEVFRLKETLGEMLDKAGLNDLENEEIGPTQMHNLIEIMKKEQDIYNIIFHELIRQTTLECTERGELLQEIRRRYAEILSRVPKQIKGLHEEVMAQRALDRRLTDELLKFKKTVTQLTDELLTVREHDENVTKAATEAKEELKEALLDSKKNTDLLSEYHDLYELQRKRMEKDMTALNNEKETWSQAAFSLALKVTEEHELTNARRLHVAEKAWVKLAKHFTILLSGTDSSMLAELQMHIDKFRELMFEFQGNMKNNEKRMKKIVERIFEGVRFIRDDFDKTVLGSDGLVEKSPTPEKVRFALEGLTKWGQRVTEQLETFGGDELLNNHDLLKEAHSHMEGWADIALEVFDRHSDSDQKAMQELNLDITAMHEQCQVRLTGENGVARLLINLSGSFEHWQTKLHVAVQGNNPLPDMDWLRFYSTLGEYSSWCAQILGLIGSTKKEVDKEDHKHLEINDMMTKTQKWLSSTMNGIESENARLIQTVSSLHTDMVQWMVQILLKIAPDKSNHSPELLNDAETLKQTNQQLCNTVLKLFTKLRTFNNYLVQCCSGIVQAIVQQKFSKYEENPEQEQIDLARMKSEFEEWIATAKILVYALTGQELQEEIVVEKKSETPSSVGQELLSRQETKLSTHSTVLEEKEETISDRDGEKEPLSASVVECEEGQKGLARVDEENTEQSTPPQVVETKHEGDELKASETISAEEERVVEGQSENVEIETQNKETKNGEEGDEKDVEEEKADLQEEQEDSGDDLTDNEKEEKEEIEAIGFDETTRPKSLQGTRDERGLRKPETEQSEKAYDTLQTIEKLQEDLINTEERAQKAEERVIDLEEELRNLNEIVRELDRKLKKSDATTVATTDGETTIAPESVISEIATKQSTQSTIDNQSLKKKEEKKKEKSKSTISKSSKKKSTPRKEAGGGEV
ncbi:DgyrCDS5863 [Dimorphilus gyrociliatus]|uniref:DgyrCDS5863 n=1 Tax=Dimorphilus gyrociliatus TaxID=2664684 RepID=A0A7I8VMS5_9ANNE|nr:DgyrCDS5863 [Dimorphilus gyrociliatus]